MSGDDLHHPSLHPLLVRNITKGSNTSHRKRSSALTSLVIMDGRERLMEFKLCELHHCINAQYSFKDQGPKDGNHHAALVTTEGICG